MMSGRILLILLVYFVLRETQASRNGNRKSSTENPGLPQILLTDTNSQEVWTIYERGTFGKNELCAVLNCRRTYYCLVKGEDAICLSKKKLPLVRGTKVFFKETDAPNSHRDPSRQASTSDPSTGAVGSKPDNTAAEWDPQRVRQKLAAYHRTLKRKQQYLLNAARPNLYEQPEKFIEFETSTTPIVQEDNAPNGCTEEQLLDIGIRLRRWFNDLRSARDRQSRARKPKVQNVNCNSKVAWTFSQLDQNSNNSLDPRELRVLTHDQREPCMQHFINACDKNADTQISYAEWCNCFTR